MKSTVKSLDSTSLPFSSLASFPFLILRYSPSNHPCGLESSIISGLDFFVTFRSSITNGTYIRIAIAKFIPDTTNDIGSSVDRKPEMKNGVFQGAIPTDGFKNPQSTEKYATIDISGCTNMNGNAYIKLSIIGIPNIMGSLILKIPGAIDTLAISSLRTCLLPNDLIPMISPIVAPVPPSSTSVSEIDLVQTCIWS